MEKTKQEKKKQFAAKETSQRIFFYFSIVTKIRRRINRKVKDKTLLADSSLENVKGKKYRGNKIKKKEYENKNRMVRLGCEQPEDN